MIRTFPAARVCMAVLLGLGLSSACSGAGSGSSGFDNPDGGNNNVRGPGGEGGSMLGPGDAYGSFGDGGGNALGDAACAADKTKAQSEPLDMFIMLDQSGSMNDTVAGGGTKWSAVTSALNTFLMQPSLAGISVGIQFFGLPASASSCPPTCQTNADCGSNGPCILNACIGCIGGGLSDSCNAADYAMPAVEIAPLPGVAPAISSAISMHSPNTGTPTSAALQGAVNHASTWATAHPGHVTIAVLATDGDPSECDTNLANIDAIAAAGVAATPKILTFVIGVGPSLGNLNGIAAAGGTTSAFVVDTGQNVNQQFLAALNMIRGAALGCLYTIPVPMSGTPDYSSVNVQYTPGGGGAPQIIPQVSDKAHCPASGNAWYYDDPAAPKQIILCDATCSAISADATGEVDVLTGCKTVIR